MHLSVIVLDPGSGDAITGMVRRIRIKVAIISQAYLIEDDPLPTPRFAEAGVDCMSGIDLTALNVGSLS